MRLNSPRVRAFRVGLAGAFNLAIISGVMFCPGKSWKSSISNSGIAVGVLL